MSTAPTRSPSCVGDVAASAAVLKHQSGARVVVVSDKDGQIYTVTNPEIVAEHQGHHVRHSDVVHQLLHLLGREARSSRAVLSR